MLEKDIATLTFRVRQCGESAGSLTANTEDLRIGSRGHTYAGSEAERGNIGHNSEFIGDMDEVMLFSAAVQVDDLGDIYRLKYYGKKTRPPSSYLIVPGAIDGSKLPSDLIGFWPLDGDGKGSHGR
jgi:hypothetical protein